MTQKSAVILLGPPGSGKTTIINKLMSGDGVQVLETGRLLRQEMAANTELGKKLKPFLDEGKLAPTEIVTEIVRKGIQQLDASVILFDGFPRRQEEISIFFDLIRENGLDRFAVIVLELPRSLAIYRLLNRRSKRPEDNPDTINKRLDLYEQETCPVIKYFETNYPDQTYFEFVDRSIKQTVNSIVTDLHQVGIEIYLSSSEIVIEPTTQAASKLERTRN